MKQEYDKYTEEDQLVWKTLFERQIENIKFKANSKYLECLDKMTDYLHPNAIPNFNSVNLALAKTTGWQVEVVPGLIPVEQFFTLLSEKKWCSSTWLRSMAQLDYLEEPDMFHDIFGHLPVLVDPIFSKFMQEFGKIGVDHIDNPAALTALQRLYWFTVEFGVSGDIKHPQVYGAGIMSSFGETNHIYNDPVSIHKFDLNKVIHHSFVNSEIQMEYYCIENFQELFDASLELRTILGNDLDVQPDIIR